MHESPAQLEAEFERILGENNALLHELERLVPADESKRIPFAAHVKKALAEGMLTFRNRLIVAMGDISALALKHQHDEEAAPKEQFAFTQGDRDASDLFTRGHQVFNALGEGVRLPKSNGRWESRRYAIELNKLREGVLSLQQQIAFTEFPHVQSVLLHTMEEARRALSRAMELHTTDEQSRYSLSRRKDGTYVALFGQVTETIDSLKGKRQEANGRAFPGTRTVVRGEGLNGGFRSVTRH